jgi:predicted AlkP superfamily pyrophosphatase or phosphodiesterase
MEIESAFTEPKETVSIESSSEKPGLVLIQIDGLSHKAVLKAIEMEYMPNFSKLIDSGKISMTPFNCGVASITEAIQSSMFYGHKIAGNHWYDKSQQKSIYGVVCEDKIEELACSEGKQGLLKNGVVAGSPLSGGAEETYVTVSSLVENMKTKGVIKSLVKETRKDVDLLQRNGYSLKNLVIDSIKDVIGESIHMAKNGLVKNLDGLLVPVLKGVGHNLFEPIVLSAFQEAIRKGKDIMYTDLASYDDIAHYFGPESKEAFEMLKSADEHIGEIMKEI